MSGKKPKTKNSEKIKFFKIGGDGEIKPAFPNDATKSNIGTNATDNSVGLKEPVFDDATENQTGELKIKKSNPQLEEQIHLLRPQVENIAKITDQNELTEDQVEVLRKYIALKETEVRDLLDQKRQYQAFLKSFLPDPP